MPLNNQNFGVVILAAGASRRMGRLKGLLKWEDGSVLEHVYNVWCNSGAAQVAVVYDPEHVAMTTELDRLGIEHRIPNVEARSGMMSSLRMASDWKGWRVDLKRVTVALVDQPQVTCEMASALLSFAKDNPDAICQPEYDGKRGHPVVFPWKDFEEIADTKEESLREFIHQRAERRRFMKVKDARLLEDMDTPEAYERLSGLRFMR